MIDSIKGIVRGDIVNTRIVSRIPEVGRDLRVTLAALR
jgi:hypothetical protein